MKCGSMIYSRTHQKRVIHSFFCPWKFFTWNSQIFCNWRNRKYFESELREERSAVILVPWLGFGGKPCSSRYIVFSSLYEEEQFLTAVVCLQCITWTKDLLKIPFPGETQISGTQTKIPTNICGIFIDKMFMFRSNALHFGQMNK